MVATQRNGSPVLDATTARKRRRLMQGGAEGSRTLTGWNLIRLQTARSRPNPHPTIGGVVPDSCYWRCQCTDRPTSQKRTALPSIRSACTLTAHSTPAPSRLCGAELINAPVDGGLGGTGTHRNPQVQREQCIGGHTAFPAKEQDTPVAGASVQLMRTNTIRGTDWDALPNTESTRATSSRNIHNAYNCCHEIGQSG